MKQSLVKIVLVVVGSICATAGLAQTIYTLQAGSAGSANALASWRDGSNNQPPNFTTTNDVFVIPAAITNAVFASGTTTTFGSGVTLQVDGRFTLGSGSNNATTRLNIDGTIEFTSTSVTQATIPTGGNPNTNTIFALGADATLITRNANGISGTNGSLSNLTSGRATVTLPTTANYEFSGAAQLMTGVPSTVSDLTFSGSGAKTFSTVTTVNGNFSMSGSATTTTTGLTTIAGNVQISGTAIWTTPAGAATSISGSLTIESGATVTLGNNAFTTTGATSVSGTLNTTGGATGLRTFTGAVIINSGGIWNLSGQNPATSFGGGITMNGTTFNNGTGTTTFSATQDLAGSANMQFGGSLSITGTLSNNNSSSAPGVRVVGNITGAITQGTNAYLTLQGTSFGTLTAAASGNTVEFNSTNSQTIPAITYHHLIFSGAGTKTTSPGTLNIGGNWSTSGGVAALNTNNTALSVTGNIAGSGNITSGSGTISLQGNWTNNGTFTAGTGTVNYSGAGQTVGSVSYNNLTLSNAGTKTAAGAVTVAGQLNTASGVIFDLATHALSGASLTTTGTGTLRTQNTSGTPLPTGRSWSMTVEYNAGGGQTIVAGNYTNLNGTGGNRTLSSTGVVGVSGTFTTGGGTYTTTSSTIDFNGTTGQSVPALNYNNLTISGNKNSNAVVLANSGTIGVAGTLSITATNATYTTAGSTIDFNGTTGQSVPALNYNNLTISGNKNSNAVVLANSGTIGVAGTLSITATNATYTSAGSTVNFNGSGAQSVPAFSFDNLTLSNAGTKTAAGAVTVAGQLNTASGVIFDLATHALSGAGLTTTGTGTLRTQNTSGTPLPTGRSWSMTVEYNAGGGQTIVAGNYTNLNGTAGNRTLSSTGVVGVSGTFTPGAGAYTTTGSTVDFNGTTSQSVPALNYNNLTISGNKNSNAVVLANSGTIGVAGTLSITATNATYTTTGSTVNFNGSGAQSVPAFSFNNLTLSNAGTKTAAGAVTVAGQLNTASGVIFDLATHALSGASLTTTGTGTLRTQNTSGTPLPTGRSWSMTVEYNAGGGQTIVAGNYTNLNGTGGNRTLSSTGVVGVSGTFTPGGGSYTSTGSTVDFNGSGSQTIPALSYNNLTSSSSGARTLASSGTIGIAGTFTPGSNSYTVTGSTIDFSGTAQTVPAFTFNNVSVTSGVNTAGGDLVVNGSLTIPTGATLNMAAHQLSGTLSSIAGTGTLRTANETAPVPTGKIWTVRVVYNSNNSQPLVAGTYNGGLTTDGGGDKTMDGHVTIAGTLNLDGGTLVIGSNNTLTFSGTAISRVTGQISASSIGSELVFSNTSNMNLPASVFAGTIRNLTVNGGASITLGNSQSIAQVLNLSNGKLGIGAGNTLTLIGTVSSMSNSNSLIGGPTANLAVSKPLAGNLGTLFFDQTTDGTTNRLNDFTISMASINDNLTLGNKLQVRNTLTPTRGLFVTGDHLVIASDNNGSGRILSINPANFAFNGNVTVERFVSSKTGRRFIFVASPVDDVTIRDAWQDDIYITGAGTGGKPCGNTDGNGVDSTDRYNTNGFDAINGTVITMFDYQQNDPARWVPIPNTWTKLVKGKGYRVLYRGARGDSLNCEALINTQIPPAPSAATMNVTGPVTSGDVPVAVDGKTTGLFGYSLIGNPYPCEIDFSLFRGDIANSGVISNKYWTYDPHSTNTNYLTYINGTVAGNSSGTINNLNGARIASGQAFFVESENGGTVTFRETHKTSNPQRGVFRTNAIKRNIRIHFTRADDTFVDNIVVVFSDDPAVTTAENRDFDATTFNSGNFLASLKGNRSFAIQTRPINFFNDTVGLRVVSSSTGNQKLLFTEFEDFTEAVQIILIDNFTGTQTDIRQQPVYPFTITSASASQGGNRFRLVFRSLNSVLPVQFLNISAQRKEGNVEVAWRLASEQGVFKYVVERSDNGRDFQAIGEVLSRGNSNSIVEYRYLDLRPLPGTAYYRIRSVEQAGPKFSDIVKVDQVITGGVVLAPNPAREKVYIHITDAAFTQGVTVMVRTLEGRTVMQQPVAGSAPELNISTLSAGNYLLTLVNREGKTITLRLMKQ